jgi:NAD(P)-dependent dehydrogenase (short-subunit alcohol dehydrogenase family)
MPSDRPVTDPELAGLRALVTGGASGIGLATARLLAARGARVACLDVAAATPEPPLEQVRADLTDDAAVRAAVRDATDRLGGLDILVNNAGVEITSLLVDLDPEQARTMLDINVLGTALGLKHAFRAMRPGGPAGNGGAVINIASVAATIAFPAISIYSATKSAVDRLTRVAAMESGKLGYGVRVNCIYPGLVPNEMGANLANDVARIGLFGSTEEAVGAVVELTPSGRLASTEDIANAVVFLASDSSGFVNGIGLPVDGGMGL